MVYFQTKNRNLGKFWCVLQWKLLVYFMNICPILRPINIFYGPLVYFVVIWYIFPRVGILYLQKSGNPDAESNFWLCQRVSFRKYLASKFQINPARTCRYRRYTYENLILYRHFSLCSGLPDFSRSKIPKR
jgi:hypothetical protein